MQRPVHWWAAALEYLEIIWGLSKIPVTFWYVRTPCASPLRALARVRISAYPIHRMQNSRGFCMLQSKSNFLCKPQQKCEEFCGLALRCHWGKCYYPTQIYEESFFVGNPFEGPGWTGGTCPGTISLAHVLRGSCARGSFGQTRFSHKTLYSGFPGQKKQKASILRPIDTPKGTILHSTCHITSEQAGHFLKTNASTDLESDQRARQKGRI